MNKNNTVGEQSYKEATGPQAWIAVSSNRQRIYGTNHVFLDDEQEFQIELYNPTSIKYLAKISINGKLVSYSGLVLKPGQRYFLDRFIDDKKKLLFSTYDIESENTEVQKAIKENGLIKVDFYAEDILTIPNWGGIYWATNTNPSYWTIKTPPNGNPIFYNTHIVNEHVNGVHNTITTTSDGFYNSDLGRGNTSYSTFSNTLGSSQIIGDLQCCSSLNSEGPKMMETGRIEKGEKSDQKFGDDYSKYVSFPSYTSEYQILPRSVKPVEVSEIRSYCPECRTRIKKKTWKFCPNCGEDLS